MKSIEDLLKYSNLINNLNLESKSIHYIIWFEEEYIEDDLIDPNSADFQSLLIDAEEKKLKLIIRNFDKAIKSQCDNINLDLDKHDKDTYWNYSYTKESEKLGLSQRFAINKLIPNDEKVFKELWLRNFINIISKIAKNIRIIAALESEENEKLLKNNHPKIFKNDKGFTIFFKMFSHYKTETKTELANFSFLFFAMEKDFLVCSQTDFVNFLASEKYNIHIDKIDSRQWRFDMNQNKKSKLFNSIKEKIVS